MKTIIYYLLLLVLAALTAGYLFSKNSEPMTMSAMVSVSAVLAVYTIAISVAGETGNPDEREILHRNMSNRAALIVGTSLFSLGIIYQIFFTHRLDFWLLGGLIAVNLTKIISLIYLDYKK